MEFAASGPGAPGADDSYRAAARRRESFPERPPPSRRGFPFGRRRRAVADADPAGVGRFGPGRAVALGRDRGGGPLVRRPLPLGHSVHQRLGLAFPRLVPALPPQPRRRLAAPGGPTPDRG